jgi:hypothetical protein
VLELGKPWEPRILVAPISGQLDLYVERRDFLIEQDDADFPFTGLDRTSFVSGSDWIRVRPETLTRRRGELRGALLARFQFWYG